MQLEKRLRHKRKVCPIRADMHKRFYVFAFFYYVCFQIVAKIILHRYLTPIYGKVYNTDMLVTHCYTFFCIAALATSSESTSRLINMAQWIVYLCICLGLAFLFQPPITPREALEKIAASPLIADIKSISTGKGRIETLPPNARETPLYPQPYHFYAADEYDYAAFITVDPQTGHVAYYKVPRDAENEATYAQHGSLWALYATPPPFE